MLSVKVKCMNRFKRTEHSKNKGQVHPRTGHEGPEVD